MQEVLGQERADRAEVHDVPRPGVVEPGLGMNADERAVAAFGHVEDRLLGDILHEAHAARAENAAVRDVKDIGTEIFDGIETLGILAVASAAASLLEDEVLQLAFARLIADGAVEGMINQQEFEDALTRAFRGRGLRLHNNSFGDGRGTGDLELGRLLDLDEAHAAYTRDLQAWMVAVVRDEDARLLRRFNDQRPGRHAHRGAVDSEINQAICHQPSALS